MTFPDRRTVAPGESFVVFLIGMRLNHWWMVPLWWPVLAFMPRMFAELEKDPTLGLLGTETGLGRTIILVQYWRSLEHLQAYAHAKQRAHVPAWKAWVQKLGHSGAVGIWHETYVVGPGQYETVYHHMPAFGLAKALGHVPATGSLATARGRIDRRDEASHPGAPVSPALP